MIFKSHIPVDMILSNMRKQHDKDIAKLQKESSCKSIVINAKVTIMPVGKNKEYCDLQCPFLNNDYDWECLLFDEELDESKDENILRCAECLNAKEILK